ncbi:MAG: hypothetical protein ABL921_01205 [Pirellula sp.]
MVTKTTDRLFTIAWVFIIFVSVFDGYLVFQCREVIGDFERNPAGLILLAINGGQVWLFLFMKLLGTIFACMWLLVIYRKHPHHALAIALPLAGLQCGLLFFLHCA